MEKLDYKRWVRVVFDEETVFQRLELSEYWLGGRNIFGM